MEIRRTLSLLTTSLIITIALHGIIFEAANRRYLGFQMFRSFSRPLYIFKGAEDSHACRNAGLELKDDEVDFAISLT